MTKPFPKSKRQEVLRDYYRGMKVTEIAEKYGIHIRTVYRYINEERSL